MRFSWILIFFFAALSVLGGDEKAAEKKTEIKSVKIPPPKKEVKKAAPKPAPKPAAKKEAKKAVPKPPVKKVVKEKTVALTIEKQKAAVWKHLVTEYDFDWTREYEGKPAEKFSELFKKEVAKILLEKFPKEKQKELQKKAKEKYPIVKKGDKVTVPVRVGARSHSYSGIFQGFEGSKAKIGDKLILKKDLPDSVVNQLIPDKAYECRSEYLRKNYYNPRGECHAKAKEDTKKLIKDKYGYIRKKKKWINLRAFLEKKLGKIGSSPEGYTGYLKKAYPKKYKNLVTMKNPAPTLKPKVITDTKAASKTKATAKTKTAPALSRKWWVCGASFKKMSGGKGDAYFITLGIASSDKKLIAQLNDKSLEVKDGNNCLASTITRLGEEKCSLPIPSTKIKVTTINKSKNIKDMLSCAFRVKGETEWLKLADFIAPGKNLPEYRISHCTKCLVAIKPGEKKCSKCQAVLE